MKMVGCLESKLKPVPGGIVLFAQLVQARNRGITVAQTPVCLAGSMGFAICAIDLRHLIELRPRPHARLDRSDIRACRIAQLAGYIRTVGIAWTGKHVCV